MLVVVLRPRRIRGLRSNELTAQNSCGKVSLLSQHKSQCFEDEHKNDFQTSDSGFKLRATRTQYCEDSPFFVPAAAILVRTTTLPRARSADTLRLEG